MAKMSKTQLIDAVAEVSQLQKSDVKTLLEALTEVGYKELREFWGVYAARFREVFRGEQARDRGANRHQSLHERADGIQGEAREQDRQGGAPESRQRRCLMLCGGVRSRRPNWQAVQLSG